MMIKYLILSGTRSKEMLHLVTEDYTYSVGNDLHEM